MATKRQELALAAEGKGCLGKSADDEPVFILVGRDLLSGGIVREWADRLEFRATITAQLTGKLKAKIAEARLLAIRMDEWSTRRLPD